VSAADRRNDEGPSEQDVCEEETPDAYESSWMAQEKGFEEVIVDAESEYEAQSSSAQEIEVDGGGQ
jgi:hypothetical protein